MNFSERLQIAQETKKSCLILSINPEIHTMKSIDYLYKYCIQKIKSSQSYICGVSLQTVYFEYFGGEGLKTFEKLIQYLRSLDLIIILDEQKSLSGSSAQMYAETFLGDGALGVDALTINPYLGSDAISPFVEQCEKKGTGLFIVTRTENPSAREFQDSEDLSIRIAEKIEEWNITTQSEKNLFSAVGGMVTGVDIQALKFFREEMPHAWILATGLTSSTQISETLQVQRQNLGLLILVQDTLISSEEDIQSWYEAQKG